MCEVRVMMYVGMDVYMCKCGEEEDEGDEDEGDVGTAHR